MMTNIQYTVHNHTRGLKSKILPWERDFLVLCHNITILLTRQSSHQSKVPNFHLQKENIVKNHTKEKLNIFFSEEIF